MKKPDWQQDKYRSILIQRNFLLVLCIGATLSITVCVSAIRYIKKHKAIEPFVIEIEQKTGVPTVVQPLDVRQYSADESIKRYFVMHYIKAREEYFAQTFERNFAHLVRVMSSPEVYYEDYRPRFSPNNPNSPYALYGSAATRTVRWKSIVFPSYNVAQVRIALNAQHSADSFEKTDKIILMSFEFTNDEMTEEDRLLNPLGFTVTMYRIEDENINY